jgi:glucans biosynthesis protein C
MKWSGTSLALSNLRALVIVVVVAVHSVLAYLDFATAPSSQLNEPPYRWLVTPIVDNHRWIGFDFFCAWQDVYLMSLLFFLSGCFVWRSLERKGTWGFLRDRFTRIGLPLAFAVAFLMPLALFPVYLRTGAAPSLSGYWRVWRRLPFWPCGPQWFLGVLLSFNVLVAMMHRFAPSARLWLGALSNWMAKNPVLFVACVTFASTIVYVPLALIFTPWAWISFGPFSFQTMHYAVYFFAGLGAGAGIDWDRLCSRRDLHPAGIRDSPESASRGRGTLCRVIGAAPGKFVDVATMRPDVISREGWPGQTALKAQSA